MRVSGIQLGAKETGTALQRRLAQLRNRGCGGGKIAQHRALATLWARPVDWLLALGLALLLTVAWLPLLDPVGSLWSRIFASGQRSLDLAGRVVVESYCLGPSLRFGVPHLEGTAGEAAVGYLASAPVTGLALISFIPILFGLIYYIFDFSLVKKLSLTLLAMLHLSFFLPFQYLLQAFVLQKGPAALGSICCIALGLPLDVLILIAFYGWGMSWPERQPRERAPSRPNGAATDAGRCAPAR